MMFSRIILTGIVMLAGFSIADTPERVVKPIDPPFLGIGKQWVDSVMQTVPRLINALHKLFMVAAYSNKSKAHQDEISRLVSQHHIGGLIFMQGGRIAGQTWIQKIAKVPLLIAIDGKVGSLDAVIQLLLIPGRWLWEP